MADNFGVNYGQNLGYNPFPRRPVFAPQPEMIDEAVPTADFSTSIPELLSPAEKLELARQAKFDWDTAQARAAKRLDALGLRKRFNAFSPGPEGLTYDAGNRDTPQLIEDEEIAPLRERLSPFFKSLSKQQEQIDRETRQQAAEKHLADVAGERRLREELMRKKLSDDFQKQALSGMMKSATFPGQKVRRIAGGYEVMPPPPMLDLADKVKQRAYESILRNAYINKDEPAIEEALSALEGLPQAGESMPTPPAFSPANRLYEMTTGEHLYPSARSTFTPPVIAEDSGRVTTKAQFDALPSGAVYIGKDGRQYQKP